MPIPIVRTGPCGSNLRITSMFIGCLSLLITTASLVWMVYAPRQIHRYTDQQQEFAMPEAGILTLTVVFLVILLLGSILLMFGVYLENKRLLLTYICIKGAFMVLVFIGFTHKIVAGQFVPRNYIHVMYCVVDTYMLYLVFCYYTVLKDVANGPAYVNQGGFNA